MTVFYGNLFIFGGGYIDPSYLSYLYNDLIMINISKLATKIFLMLLASNEISTVDISGSPPDARWSHQAAPVVVAQEEKLYIMGGLYYSSFTYKDIYVVEEGSRDSLI